MRQPTRMGYIACYAIYALLLALDIAVLLIWRVAILVLIVTLIGPSGANTFVYDLSLIVLGLGLFSLIIAAEPYLRNGVKQGRLLYRAARLGVPLALFGMLGLLLGMWL
jgi:hypothetical protein